jgi:hypothetical protein
LYNTSIAPIAPVASALVTFHAASRVMVLVMTQGIGANLTNDEKRAHLIDLKRGRLIDQVCIQEILPPET